MPSPLPALNLIATPGLRRATLETAREIERRGFAGISVSSSFANMAQCTGLAFATERITFATAIAPIYAQTVEEFAHGEIAEGMVFSGGSRAHMAESLAVLPAEKRADPAFFIGNRIRTCISDDIAEAKAVLRQTMSHYADLPYYRNYWKEAGYIEEMTAIEAALAAGRRDEVPRYLTDHWLADVTLFGPAARVRDGLDAWREAGIKTPVVVPLSADGDQNTALSQVFAAFAD